MFLMVFLHVFRGDADGPSDDDGNGDDGKYDGEDIPSMFFCDDANESDDDDGEW